MRTEENEVIPKFHEIVRTYFRGPLKPPFNETAIKAAGFGPKWYEPLAVKEANQSFDGQLFHGAIRFQETKSLWISGAALCSK
ncbi:hypothetical protein PIB30_014665 [Stylosanthes scabra]|uniref:Uncharacterized protein n=1 Tax=Stylosanthes scabra TaxID=79078 RepID=A0ABU6T6G4_9FABA|nr:hypothetical protein [Stylosanthes scabra]